MKPFFRQVMLFLITLGLVQVLINNFLLKKIGTPYFQNVRFATKYDQFLNSQEQFNTVFIGSSRTYRHINPQIIDSTLAAYNVKSYNLGAPSTFMPETYYLLDMMMDNQPKENPLRYVFMEISEINYIPYINWFSPQSYYFINFDLLKLIWNIHFHNPDLHWVKAFVFTGTYIQGFFFNQIIPQNTVEPTPETLNYTGEHRDGYYPLEIDLEENHSEKIIKRHEELLNDSTILIRKKDKQTRRKREDISGAFPEYLNDLVKKAEAKNIQLYFIIPPKLKYYHSLASLKELVHDHRVIDMGNYDEYPHLNFLEYNFDRGHFNTKGSTLYSSYLAEKIAVQLRTEADSTREQN